MRRGHSSAAAIRLDSIEPNNWLPLLAFRKRLLASDVDQVSSASSVTLTEKTSETMPSFGTRNIACQPTSVAKRL